MTTGTAEVPTAESQRPLTLGRFTVAGIVLGVVLSFAVFGFTPDAVVASVFASTLVVLAAIDLERRIIPNRIVLPATAIVLVLNIAAHPSQWVEWVGENGGDPVEKASADHRPSKSPAYCPARARRKMRENPAAPAVLPEKHRWDNPIHATPGTLPALPASPIAYSTN